MDRNVNWTDNAKTTTQTNSGGESRYLNSQVWFNEMQDNYGGTGVEIIELDSGNSRTSSSQEEPYENIQNTNHRWSYVSNDRLEDSYPVNRQARLRRRLRNAEEHDSLQSDSFHFNGEPDAIALNQNTNSYTIHKDSEARFDYSLESIEDVETEETGFKNAAFRREWNGENSCGEVVTFNTDLDGEKRMIWIYSFKNRGLLSDNDYEMVNIPCQSDSLSTSSPECVDQCNNKDRVAYGGRVASPIPTTCIPRLNLSLAATLPNVTEVSEPKSSKTANRNKVCNPIQQKTVNGWFTDKAEKTEAVSKKDASNSILNWMALSPRERRRRSRNTATDVHNMGQLQPLAEIVSYSKGKSPTIEPFTEITKDDAKSKGSLQMEQRKNEAKKEVISPVVGDRGDYNKFVHRPRIKFDKPCLSAPTRITEPIEKLDTHNWIAEHAIKPNHEPMLFAQDCNQSALSAASKLSAGDRLSARNMTFLVPSEWTEYCLVGDSHISLQLSLGQASDAERRGRLGSLLRRCASCFKCCKYRV